jgi:truncated hemoglobin YjbI
METPRKEPINLMRAILTAAVLMAAFLFGAASPAAAGTPAGAPAKDKKSMGKKSLYDRLGGKKALVAVVDDFVGNVAGDARINGLFAQAAADPKRMKKFKKNLVDQLCEATGGPCKYKGLDMVTSHKGMNITDEQFGALVEDLIKTLDKFKVGEPERTELLTPLAGMKGDIVGK